MSTKDIKQYNKLYYQKNREKILKRRREIYRNTHPKKVKRTIEMIKKQRQIYYLKNKKELNRKRREYNKMYCKAYYAKNKKVKAIIEIKKKEPIMFIKRHVVIDFS
jgi:hypothetical protein